MLITLEPINYRAHKHAETETFPDFHETETFQTASRDRWHIPVHFYA